MLQIVNLHYMLSKATVKSRPTVLWCYKDKLELSRSWIPYFCLHAWLIFINGHFSFQISYIRRLKYVNYVLILESKVFWRFVSYQKEAIQFPWLKT